MNPNHDPRNGQFAKGGNASRAGINKRGSKERAAMAKYLVTLRRGENPGSPLNNRKGAAMLAKEHKDEGQIFTQATRAGRVLRGVHNRLAIKPQHLTDRVKKIIGAGKSTYWRDQDGSVPNRRRE